MLDDFKVQPGLKYIIFSAIFWLWSPAWTFENYGVCSSGSIRHRNRSKNDCLESIAILSIVLRVNFVGIFKVVVIWLALNKCPEAEQNWPAFISLHSLKSRFCSKFCSSRCLFYSLEISRTSVNSRKLIGVAVFQIKINKNKYNFA